MEQPKQLSKPFKICSCCWIYTPEMVVKAFSPPKIEFGHFRHQKAPKKELSANFLRKSDENTEESFDNCPQF